MPEQISTELRTILSNLLKQQSALEQEYQKLSEVKGFLLEQISTFYNVGENDYVTAAGEIIRASAATPAVSAEVSQVCAEHVTADCSHCTADTKGASPVASTVQVEPSQQVEPLEELPVRAVVE